MRRAIGFSQRRTAGSWQAVAATAAPATPPQRDELLAKIAAKRSPTETDRSAEITFELSSLLNYESMSKTLFLSPPSFDGFDGGAGARYQARREVTSFWYPTWLAQPAALVPNAKLMDCPPHDIDIKTMPGGSEGLRSRHHSYLARRR